MKSNILWQKLISTFGLAVVAFGVFFHVLSLDKKDSLSAYRSPSQQQQPQARLLSGICNDPWSTNSDLNFFSLDGTRPPSSVTWSRERLPSGMVYLGGEAMSPLGVGGTSPVRSLALFNQDCVAQVTNHIQQRTNQRNRMQQLGRSNLFSIDGVSSRAYCVPPTPENSRCTYEVDRDPMDIMDLSQLTPRYLAEQTNDRFYSYLSLLARSYRGLSASDYQLLSRVTLYFANDSQASRSLFSRGRLLTYERTQELGQYRLKEEDRKYLRFIGFRELSQSDREFIESMNTGEFPFTTQLPYRFPQNYQSLAQKLVELSQSLSQEWAKLRRHEVGNFPNWFEVFRNRQSETLQFQTALGEPQFKNAIRWVLQDASMILAHSQNPTALFDAASAWWTIREMQLDLSCDGSNRLLRPEYAENVVMQYNLSSCRGSYAGAAVNELNEYIAGAAGAPNSGLAHANIEVQFDSIQWWKLYVLGSRRERARNLTAAINHMITNLQRGPDQVGNIGNVKFLAAEADNVRREFEAGKVVTWLGLKPMSDSDRTELGNLKSALSRFFIALGDKFTRAPWDNYGLYSTLRAIWEPNARFLELREWSDLIPQTVAEDQVNSILSRLLHQVRPADTPVLNQINEYFQFISELFSRDPQQSLRVCGSIKNWLISLSDTVPSDRSRGESYQNYRFAYYANSCFQLLSEILQTRSSFWTQRANSFDCQGYDGALTCALNAQISDSRVARNRIRWKRLILEAKGDQKSYQFILRAFIDKLTADQRLLGTRYASVWRNTLREIAEGLKEQVTDLILIPTPREFQRCYIGGSQNGSSNVVSLASSSVDDLIFLRGSLIHSECVRSLIPRRQNSRGALWIFQMAQLGYLNQNRPICRYEDQVQSALCGGGESWGHLTKYLMFAVNVHNSDHRNLLTRSQLFMDSRRFQRQHLSVLNELFTHAGEGSEGRGSGQYQDRFRQGLSFYKDAVFPLFIELNQCLDSNAALNEQCIPAAGRRLFGPFLFGR